MERALYITFKLKGSNHFDDMKLEDITLRLRYREEQEPFEYKSCHDTERIARKESKTFDNVTRRQNSYNDMVGVEYRYGC